MSSITVSLKNSHREPLEDMSRILVYRQRDRKLLAEATTSLAKVEFRGLDIGPEVYHVRVFPKKHRSCAAFARAGARVSLHSPINPESVRRLHFPGLGGLEGMIRNPEELEREQLAAAFNIWAKLKHTRLGGGTAADCVKRITRINGDRLFFVPDGCMLELVREAIPAEFVSVSGALPGYGILESFKTLDLYGNLQLTFLEGERGDLLVDADIDEAAGLLHLFHVLKHAITGEKTHPYNVHEILTFYQELDTGYRLIV